MFTLHVTPRSNPVRDVALVTAGSAGSQVSVLFMNLLKAGNFFSFFNKYRVSSIFLTCSLSPVSRCLIAVGWLTLKIPGTILPTHIWVSELAGGPWVLGGLQTQKCQVLCYRWVISKTDLHPTLCEVFLVPHHLHFLPVSHTLLWSPNLWHKGKLSFLIRNLGVIWRGMSTFCSLIVSRVVGLCVWPHFRLLGLSDWLSLYRI